LTFIKQEVPRKSPNMLISIEGRTLLCSTTGDYVKWIRL